MISKSQPGQSQPPLIGLEQPVHLLSHVPNGASKHKDEALLKCTKTSTPSYLSSVFGNPVNKKNCGEHVGNLSTVGPLHAENTPIHVDVPHCYFCSACLELKMQVTQSVHKEPITSIRQIHLN